MSTSNQSFREQVKANLAKVKAEAAAVDRSRVPNLTEVLAKIIKKQMEASSISIEEDNYTANVCRISVSGANLYIQVILTDDGGNILINPRYFKVEEFGGADFDSLNFDQLMDVDEDNWETEKVDSLPNLLA